MNLQQFSRRSFLSYAAQAAIAFKAKQLFPLASPSIVTLRTPSGPLRGEQAGGVRVFRGVPFAQPPIGPLRFRPTQQVNSWTSPRDATRFAPAALQPNEPAIAQSEDCLYLNVWAPAAKGSYPVYVWIHGGGFTGGRSFEPMFDGTMLATEGIICVSVAYRLGLFGFLDLGPLLGPAFDGSANNGLRDLIAALEWVQRNIEAFGGDPSRVTLGGQSAGAKLTGLLMGTPSAKPLFQQMISESGGAERVWGKNESIRVAEGFGKLWQSQTGHALSALTSAPAESLIPVQTQLMNEWPHHFPLRAQIDGSLIPHRPVETIATGSTRGKRLLIGTNRDESAYFLGPHPEHDAEAANLGNMETSQFLEVYRKYAAVYPEMSVEQRRIRALTAEEYLIPTVRVAESHVRGGGSAWMYRLDFVEGSGRLGAFTPHSLELRLVWDRPVHTVANASAESKLAEQMHETWCAFLKGSSPGSAGLPEWPEYTLQDRKTMIFDEQSEVATRPLENELKLWDKLL
jgi:para-nitrobenzyl esterase